MIYPDDPIKHFGCNEFTKAERWGSLHPDDPIFNLRCNRVDPVERLEALHPDDPSFIPRLDRPDYNQVGPYKREIALHPDDLVFNFKFRYIEDALTPQMPHRPEMPDWKRPGNLDFPLPGISLSCFAPKHHLPVMDVADWDYDEPGISLSGFAPKYHLPVRAPADDDYEDYDNGDDEPGISFPF
jgi:hypothetical protein